MKCYRPVDTYNKSTIDPLRHVLDDFLEALEVAGGERAFQVIKSCIPDYMRCVRPPLAPLLTPS
eukprot:602003-Prorocentrum_minimum.AAC.1